ncbi:alpha-hydroxy-acid oxidizing enzyme [Kaistia algarum]|uniref:alpha-hydroxy acid oxidase n=1 Tax=Kaistia algarum TaxID=2083279 RepID=UPI000CE85D5C|nr:alpha-hydroxy acid oxidase [Kaistia algarum]MCX5516736.1 alpha-hydroxy acid oxidase [Kaistia algarum]PPE78629.1 alpha-hydroxy-acid oxidizing enzyme [Kaistia algarum]
MMAASNDDMRRAAKRRLPRMFFDYLDGGSFSEVTLRRNRSDFDALVLEQRILRDVRSRSMAAHFLGGTWAAPMMLGPVGFSGMMRGNGELQASRAAEKAGIPYCLSTFSVNSLAQIAAAGAAKPCFQLYVFKDRALTESMLAMAQSCGVETLFLTVDANVSGIRERDTRNGFRTATRLPLRALVDMAMHPAWCLDIWRAGSPRLGNIAGRSEFGRGIMAQASRLSEQIDPGLSWEDLAWLRRQWPGRLVIKGILSVADARRAVEIGVEGIAISNHGGRQLDAARSSISVLPAIAQTVGRQTEILLDSGIRRGTDVYKALALGADAVLLGRAFAYGLAAAGEAGVAAVISHIKAELDVAMALTGVRDLAELKADGPEIVRERELRTTAAPSDGMPTL